MSAILRGVSISGAFVMPINGLYTAHATAVGIGPKADGGYGLKVDLVATLSGLSQNDAEKVVAAGHTVCPYSNAVRGNVDVAITVRTA